MNSPHPTNAANKSLSTLIVEDDPAFADTLQSLLKARGEFTSIRIAGRLDSALRMAGQSPIDLCIVDLNLPDGDGCALVEALSDDVTCVVLTVSGREADVIRAIRCGASGYLLKDEPDIAGQLLSVASGSFPISARIAAHLVRHWRDIDEASAAPTPPNDPTRSKLSTRELEILTVLAQGNTYQETAEQLLISPHTVADHVKNIYRKLAVTSRSGAVYRASQLGYLNLNNPS